jgi:hypothetical protein
LKKNSEKKTSKSEKKKISKKFPFRGRSLKHDILDQSLRDVFYDVLKYIRGQSEISLLVRIDLFPNWWMPLTVGLGSNPLYEKVFNLHP